MTALYFTVGSLIVGVVVLALGAVRRDRMWRRKKVKQLTQDVAQVLAIPEGHAQVQAGPLARRSGLSFMGTLMLGAAGSPSIKRESFG